MTLTRLLFMSFAMVLLNLSAVPAVTAGEVAKGKKQPYTEVRKPLPVSGDKIEIVEYFWYGCPHCYSFEPVLKKWLETQPDDITFRRVPAVLTDAWLPQAKAFYIAEKLGIAEDIHPALFDHIHRKKRRLNKQKSLREFFSEYDVDKKVFNELYLSKEVTDKIKMGLRETQRLRISGVPTMSVQGKYVTSARQAGSNEEMLETIETLITKERRLMAKKQEERALEDSNL